MIGRLTGDNFAAPKDQLNVDGELVRSFGLNLDVTAFLPKNWLAR